MKNILKPLAIDIPIPLGLTAAASETNAAIQNKFCGPGMCLPDIAKWSTIIILNEEMDDIMKIVKSLKEFSLLMKDVKETIKNEAKEQKNEFLGMLLGTLGTSLFGNLLTSKNWND